MTRSRVILPVLFAIVAVVGGVIVINQVGDDPTGSDTSPTTTGRSTTTTSTTTTSSTTVAASSSTSSTAPTSTTTSTVTPQPPSPVPAVVVREGSASQPRIALTFDAGSDAGATSRILDMLAERGIPASFGLTGRWVEQYPDLAREIADRGHRVINHTQNHFSFTGFSTNTAPLTRQERVAQLQQAEGAIRAVAGADSRPWFRPPYGDYDDSVLVDVATAGYGYVIMWSVDSLGWRGDDPADVARRTIGALEPGAIALMHLGSASTDVDALPAILDAVADRGLEPVTIDELVSR